MNATTEMDKRRTYRPCSFGCPSNELEGITKSLRANGMSEVVLSGVTTLALMERELSMPVEEKIHKNLEVPDIKGLRKRLSPDPDKSLTQERFGQFMGVSWSTVARWEGGGNPGDRMTKRLVRLDQGLERLEGLILREDVLAFFDQPNQTLLQARPIDLLDNDATADAVMQLIDGIETGAF